jgi:uncharacterized Tic20 family protein
MWRYPIDAPSVSGMTRPASPSPEPNPPEGASATPYSPVWYPPVTREAPRSGYSASSDRTWTLIAHYGGAAGMVLGGATLGWVAPMVAMIVRGDRSPTVRAHAAAAVNFQLTWSMIAAFGYLALCTIVGRLLTVVVVPGAGLMGIIFGIVAGLRASRGELYRYPVSIPFLK